MMELTPEVGCGNHMRYAFSLYKWTLSVQAWDYDLS